MERLVVGRIAKAHGIRGEVSIEVLSDAPDRFAPGRAMQAGDRSLTVEASRAHHDRVLVKFREVGDRSAAEALRGASLTIEGSDAAALPEGSWYPHELEGLAVVDEDGAALGRWARAESGRAHDVWIVATAHGDVMVPAVREIVRRVDVEAGVIVLAPPDGLFE